MVLVVQSFRNQFKDLARRADRGDESIAGCLMGYTSANPAISGKLLELYEECVGEVAREKEQVAV
jgi:hypothetical protein